MLVHQERPEADYGAVLVRYLYTQSGSAGHAVDADRYGPQRQRKVVLEVHDLADLDAGRGLELEYRDHRAGADGLDRALDAELGATAADQLAKADQLGLVHGAPALPHLEEVDRRQGPGGDLRDERERGLGLPPLARSACGRRLDRRSFRGSPDGLAHGMELVILPQLGGADAPDPEVRFSLALRDARGSRHGTRGAHRQVDPVRGRLGRS